MAELVEGRALTERNGQQYVGAQTQGWRSTTSRLLAVRNAAQKDKKRQFTNLMHHLTIDLLRESYMALKRDSAPGVDSVKWYDYKTELERRLKLLHEKIHSGRYRPKPARRVFIPKEDGSQRPLSVICLEDKIVQQAVVTLLNSIYEVDFLGFSYGFRPGRSQHSAMDALTIGIHKRKVNWVLDMDISKFFDTVKHEWLIRFIEHRIKDQRILRLITKWLKAGIIDENGHRRISRLGTPQGAVVSPLLANIYLHYALDLWTHKWRGQKNRKEVIVVRYADDVVLGFQDKWDSNAYLNDVRIRLAKFGLKLNMDKTRLLRFGRFAATDRKSKGEGKPETFDFLGFTFYCSQSRNGFFYAKRKTSNKRLRKQIKAIGKEIMRRRHDPITKMAKWLRSVVQGHINYYGVPFNSDALGLFCYEIRCRWYKALCRRSQKKKINWETFSPIVDYWIPNAKIVHPYPEKRFFAIHSK